MFFMAAQTDQSIDNMRLSYDVDEQGKAFNVRYVGPPEYLKHTTRQKLSVSVRLRPGLTLCMARQAAFATGCEFDLTYIVDWDRAADGNVRSGRHPQGRVSGYPLRCFSVPETVAAMAGAAASGNGETELTLISHRTKRDAATSFGAR